jgi:hypothetical protein
MEMQRDDIHLVTVCPSNDETKGQAFESPNEFRKWYNDAFSGISRPKRFYSFTLPFEYGTMLGWELLNVNEPQQSWTDEPLNLFYIDPLKNKRKIPVIDTRAYFSQILHDKRASANLKALGKEMSDHFKVDAHKFDNPMEEAFGTRKPTHEEMPTLVEYGIRDAYIAALAGEWIEENIIDGWLAGKNAKIEDIVSWGTVAKEYLDLPRVAQYRYTQQGTGRQILGFYNKWNYQIMNNAIFAGRSEAFCTGNLGKVYYCDVSSLYPCSIVKSQAMRIKEVEKIPSERWPRLLGKMTWEEFNEATDKPYGWIKGTFRTSDDLWGLPTRCSSDEDEDESGLVIYATGIVHGFYHTLDLEASNAVVLDVEYALGPVFDNDPSSKYNQSADLYEGLLDKKLSGNLDPIEETCLKLTLNAASGKIGEHQHGISHSTNPPAYSTLLAQSHTIMSKIMHKYHSPASPIFYTDTDSIFTRQKVEGIIDYLEPYPNMPYRKIDKLPLKLKIKGTTRPEGCVIFRNKMYYQSPESVAHHTSYSLARGGWKGDPSDYSNIVENKLGVATVRSQVARKWKTKDKKAAMLKTGRWYTKKEQWNLPKIKRIFRADYKRNRTPEGKDGNPGYYDSYQLHLDDRMQMSRAWRYDEVLDLQGIPPPRPEATATMAFLTDQPIRRRPRITWARVFQI